MLFGHLDFVAPLHPSVLNMRFFGHLFSFFELVPSFEPDFPSHIVNENQAITVYRPLADEGRENINKMRFGVPENQKDNF